jgi:hypothetical protein
MIDSVPSPSKGRNIPSDFFDVACLGSYANPSANDSCDGHFDDSWLRKVNK